ncbi:MAG: DUF4293 domain-containing protein [Bacteroidales bacterium]|jgi:magnesium-transporting ATPase (P-type)|nr:DUF4293 domain-containing protein [Bacteroidales bacterium]
MIQRIQSLFLAVSTLLIILLLVLPIGVIYTAADVNGISMMYNYNAFVIKEAIPDGKVVLSCAYIGILLIMSALLSFATIFLYKNRFKQIRWTTAAMYLYIITIVMMTFIFPELIFKKALGASNKPDLIYNHQWLLIILIMSTALLLFFAKKFIIKDEKKVREADRLR